MKTLRFLFLLMLYIPFMGTTYAQEKLYENFNKSDLQNFPSYAWTMIDADGDGVNWTVGPDGVDGTNAAESYIWMFTTYQPDNWLVTPQLEVTSNTDSLSFYLGSYQGQSNYIEVWVSTEGPNLESFTDRIDSVTFNKTVDHYNRSISLADYVGQKIYIAFRHLYKAELPEIDNTISIMLDNVSGPAVVPFETEVGISEIIYYKGITEPCDIADQPITVVVTNYAKTAVSNFELSCQAFGLDADSNAMFSDIITETVNRTLEAGDTLHYTFQGALPFSEYANDNSHEVLVRSFLGKIEEDSYQRNDTLIIAFPKQNSFELPMNVGFESYYPDQDPGFEHWNTSMYPSSYSMNPFSVGENPAMAHSGNQYLVASVYPPDGFTPEQTPQTGDNVYVTTRCLALEAGKDYRIDMFYGFRVLPSDWEKQGINFRVVVGKDSYHLLDQPHEVVLDTFLTKTQDLIMPNNAIYSMLNSQPFQIKESGVYYMGLVFYSDKAVAEQKDTWVFFVDDFSLCEADAPVPADLLLEKVSVPSDCNLTDAEEISAVIRNVSATDLSDVTISYTINGQDTVKETIKEKVPAGQQYTYYFETKADLSNYGKYGIEVIVEHASDVDFTDNNVKTAVAVNSEVAPLPYVDDFEEYATTKVFEDEWKVYMEGYYTWGPAQDYTEDTAYAYNGIGFLADATWEENYVAQNEWAISRCFEFKKDKTYEISFMYRIEKEATVPASLNAFILSTYDTTSKVKEIVNFAEIKNASYQQFAGTFKPEEDMVAHFALHSYSQVGAPIIMIDALSIKEQTESSVDNPMPTFFSVYPNPVQSELNVTSSVGISKIEVYNLLGTRIYTEELNGTETRIGTENFTNGIYLLVVTTLDGERGVTKFIKK